MRIAFVAALAVCVTLLTNMPLSSTTDDGNSDYSEFLEELDRIHREETDGAAVGLFFINEAIWNREKRILLVEATTLMDKGALLTVAGLPDSTWVDAFKISTGDTVEFRLRIPEGQAVPCQISVNSAATSKIADVEYAPAACSNRLAIEGTVSVGPDLRIADGRVTVAVGDNLFTTNTDATGNYSLEVYSDSPDSIVTITAEGMNRGERFIQLTYAGGVSRL